MGGKILFLTLFIMVLVPLAGSRAAAPINISNDLVLNFGKVVKPSSGSVRVVVNRNGNLGGNTNAIILDSSSISIGSNLIKGSPNSRDVIAISLDECASNSAIGLRLRNFRARYANIDFNNSEVNLPAPGNKGTLLTYGAALVISSSARTGVQNPCYDITVNYD